MQGQGVADVRLEVSDILRLSGEYLCEREGKVTQHLIECDILSTSIQLTDTTTPTPLAHSRTTFLLPPCPQHLQYGSGCWLVPDMLLAHVNNCCLGAELRGGVCQWWYILIRLLCCGQEGLTVVLGVEVVRVGCRGRSKNVLSLCMTRGGLGVNEASITAATRSVICGLVALALRRDASWQT
ncbi:hypothetical protein E2C01_096470 [Portunus trituberculatus]|uniref:Uncharacterized protein n=1 Tax=Portunus trituberculatus TaxID=210409 RepID=A0A5B7JY17_PORTR|nr:hypothetical protein [Portunus trituberculatus]